MGGSWVRVDSISGRVEYLDIIAGFEELFENSRSLYARRREDASQENTEADADSQVATPTPEKTVAQNAGNGGNSIEMKQEPSEAPTKKPKAQIDAFLVEAYAMKRDFGRIMMGRRPC